jgi:hypothetical protein
MVRWIVCVVMAMGVALPALAQEERVAELERKVDVLSREIEQMRLGAVAETTAYASRMGFGPAASKVYSRTRGTSVGGYGEMLVARPDRTRQDDTPSGGADRIDFLRAVFYVGHKFSDELLLNTEVEWEHAGIKDEAEVSVDPLTGQGGAELSGEVVLEFAYLDWSRQRAFGIRAGKLLVPVGLVNEQHEPPVFFGARRPETERIIIPTTWAGNGLGLFGELANGLAYRAYVMEGLDAGHFSASQAIRGGRQGGSQSLLEHPAFVARVDWTSTVGLTIGGSAFTGNAWQQPQPVSGPSLDPTVTLFDLHARFEWRGLQARGLLVRGSIGDASALSDALGLTGADRLGEAFGGGYLEAAYDVLPSLAPGTRMGLLPYVRFEVTDTQDDVAAPGLEDPAHHHELVTAGLAFRPDPNVVLKVDREQRKNDARTETSQWNLAIGYLF